MCDFMATTTSPQLASAAPTQIDQTAAARGAVVFQSYCASCHSNSGKQADILSDDQLHPAKGLLANELAGDIGTNPCRSKTTNWQTGHIWQAFSSDEQRDHKYGQPGAYRDFPLAGIWATAPFFHNNQLGPQPDLTDPGVFTVAGRLAIYEQSMDQLLNPWKRSAHVETTTDWTVLPQFPYLVPPGTPVGLFANVDPKTSQNLCSDLVENEGHYFGALLSDSDKHALTEYLKTK